MSQLKITHQSNDSITNVGIDWKNTITYEQGDTGGLVQFYLVCKNLPLGTRVGFNSNKPGPNPPIDLPATIVATYPSFIAGIVSQVPANYNCEITYFAIFETPPPDNASIQFQAAMIVN